MYDKYFYLPSHGFMVHFDLSFSSSGHFFPPYFGAGLEHVLLRNFTPEPQLTVHALHVDQADQPPSTKVRKKII